MKSSKFLPVAIIAIPLLVAGCVIEDTDPDYVRGQTTVIERESPPKVDVEVHTPPIEIKTQTPSKSTTGY